MRLLAVLAIGLAVLGCKDNSRPQNRPAGLTEADAREFATWMSERMTKCDEDTLVTRIDRAAFTARLPLTVPDAGQSAAHQICAWMQGIKSYSLVGIKTVDNQPVAIMRRLLVDPSTGAVLVNYDRLSLSLAEPAPKTHLVDLFSYRQGLWISEALASQSPSLDITHARDLVAQGKQDEAMAAIEKLPVSTRRDLMLRAFLQTHSLPEPQQRAARDELAKAFPDDPSIALTMIDAGMSLRDFDSVQHWCDVLTKELGRDAFLDMTRAIAFLQAGKLDQALAASDAAIKTETALTRAHEVRLDILIAQKKWPEVLAEMTELEAKHDMGFDEAKLRGEPRLAELVTTPEFATWLAGHAQRN